MITAGQIINDKQDHRDKTEHGQQGRLSSHCLLPHHGFPVSGSSGQTKFSLLSFGNVDLGKGKAALPKKKC